MTSPTKITLGGMRTMGLRAGLQAAAVKNLKAQAATAVTASRSLLVYQRTIFSASRLSSLRATVEIGRGMRY
jgi:hypothetical protein